jgi:hypothetical protein
MYSEFAFPLRFAVKRGPLAETDEPPYITLAQDLLRESAALERYVRIALQASESGAAPLRRGSRHPRRTAPRPADVSKMLAPAADVGLAAGAAPADVSGAAAPAADVSGGAGEAEEAEAEPVPDFIAELAPLPVQSMPSILGFLSGASEPVRQVDDPCIRLCMALHVEKVLLGFCPFQGSCMLCKLWQGSCVPEPL